ncbi:MAG: Asp-tRNA(Asn)/Glu-tRNA(Gln) amidotransferase subunit GatC [Candidatus Buchananbacteria bacterium]
MALSIKDVEHIAMLARLGLTEAEKEKFAGQLSSILDYFEQLKEVNTDNVEPTAQVTGLENVLRPDVVENVDAATMKKLIELAPDQQDNLVKAKSVF